MGRLNRRIARFFGYDLMRYNKSFRFDATMDRLLRNFSFDCVIDVGANVGGFSQLCLNRLATAPIHAFEPAGDLARELTQRATGEPRWHVVRSALGDEIGQASLNISRTKSVFNSLSQADPAFAAQIEGLDFAGSEDVPISTLDRYAADNGLGRYTDILLKVDTQGHDFKVLKGARETLGRTRCVIVELPFQNIYRSSDNHKDILAFMDEAGFDIYSLSPISSDDKGALIEADGFFMRR